MSLRNSGRVATLSLVSSLFALDAFAATVPGERTFIDRVEVVPNAVLTAVGRVLPESLPINTQLVSDAYEGNLTVTEPTTISVTFVWEGAGYRNALGYYTYTIEDGQYAIVDRQLIFPNASFADPNKGWGGGRLATGDTVSLRDANGNIRTFQPGERVGFFCVADGWNGTSVTGWSSSTPLPFQKPSQNASVARGVSTTLDVFNPESTNLPHLSRRFAMVKLPGISGFLDGDDFVLIGAEDIRRDWGSDNDFNDVVFVAHSQVETGILDSALARLDPNVADADADGIRYTADAFPNDAARAFSIKTPSWGHHSIAFEDNYPAVGDSDYNDAVILSSVEVISDARNAVKEIIGTYTLIARGASLEHRFGVAISGIPEGTSGTVEYERFDSDGTNRLDAAVPITGMLKRNASGTLAVRLDDVFPSTRDAFATVTQGFVNTTTAAPETPPAAVRFRLIFDTAVDARSMATAPFDPYLSTVHGDELYDIHLIGRAPFADRPAHLPAESGSFNFVDSNLQPFALLVPTDWRYPLEKIRIGAQDLSAVAYPRFFSWQRSRGTTDLDWYVSPSTTPKRVTNVVASGLGVRTWSLRAGG